MEYEIVTGYRVFDKRRTFWDEDFDYMIQLEQRRFLESVGMDFDSNLYKIEWFDGMVTVSRICDAVNCLRAKEGCDLVRFSDMKIGFVGYYNDYPVENNYFKIRLLK